MRSAVIEPSGANARVSPADHAVVSLRAYPYPYKAALAICSDLDETPTAAAYFDMMRFLNTTEATPLGQGVGLEVGNSIYFDMERGQFAYWNADERGRAAVRACIRSGHIDCLHSFGDLATTREHAGRALDELARHDCAVKVWVDHATAPTNFGADIMEGQGDVPGSPAYHADLTIAFGVEYVWAGRVTSVLGQNAPRRLAGILSGRHPIASAVTVIKEAAKGALARAGSAKYRPHAANDLFWRARLRNSHETIEFLRSNPSWGGVSCDETGDGFGRVVTPAILQALVDREAACILYTHLGKLARHDRPLNAGSRSAFERVAARARDGSLLVTTTRRLLDYVRMTRELTWSVVATRANTIAVRITSDRDGRIPRQALEGLTFYVPDAARADIVVDGREVRVDRNPPDHTGQPSISVPWSRLTFPQVA
jgi:hypothetical protein